MKFSKERGTSLNSSSDDEDIIFAKNGKASVIDARPSKESSLLNASQMSSQKGTFGEIKAKLSNPSTLKPPARFSLF
jgi:hypothetical protein